MPVEKKGYRLLNPPFAPNELLLLVDSVPWRSNAPPVVCFVQFIIQIIMDFVKPIIDIFLSFEYNIPGN